MKYLGYTVPSHLREKMIGSVHGGGHFSNDRVYNSLVQSWWWDGMYTDVSKHCKNCPLCVFASGARTTEKFPLDPIDHSRLWE